MTSQMTLELEPFTLVPYSESSESFCGNALFAYRAEKQRLLSQNIDTMQRASHFRNMADHRSERADGLALARELA